MKFIDEIPDLYRQFLPAVFFEDMPDESLSTCANCAMVCDKSKKKEELIMSPFEANVKCCTYFPYIPNYLIGALLSDKNEQFKEGQRRIIQKIRDRKGVAPSGIFPPTKWTVIYANIDRAFGKSESLLCPYYLKESGNCSVWKYRDAVCSTYFCKSVNGELGKKFWSKTKTYLIQVQKKLRLYCYDQLNVSQQSITQSIAFQDRKKLTVEDLDDLPMKDKAYNELWENWAGKEVEFFKQCYDLVKNLTKEEFENICGVDVKMTAKQLLDMREKILHLPEYLIKTDNAELIFAKDENNYTVKFKEIDSSFTLPKVTLDIFDGKTKTQDILSKLNENHGIELDNDLVVSLSAYGILQSCNASEDK